MELNKKNLQEKLSLFQVFGEDFKRLEEDFHFYLKDKVAPEGVLKVCSGHFIKLDSVGSEGIGVDFLNPEHSVRELTIREKEIKDVLELEKNFLLNVKILKEPMRNDREDGEEEAGDRDFKKGEHFIRETEEGDIL